METKDCWCIAKNLFLKKKTHALIAEQEEVSLLRTLEHEELQQ